jgi:hypothetical protein
LLVLLVAVAAYWYATGGLSPAGSTVAQFSGDGDQVTDPFPVREGWLIRWESTGTRFAFAVTGDRDFGILVDRQGPASGSTALVSAGTYRLEVTADGPWTVRITQGR